MSDEVEAAPAAPDARADVAALIDAFRAEVLHNTSVSRDTELWNAVHARLETLKADLSRLITET